MRRAWVVGWLWAGAAALIVGPALLAAVAYVFGALRLAAFAALAAMLALPLLAIPPLVDRLRFARWRRHRTRPEDLPRV